MKRGVLVRETEVREYDRREVLGYTDNQYLALYALTWGLVRVGWEEPLEVVVSRTRDLLVEAGKLEIAAVIHDPITVTADRVSTQLSERAHPARDEQIDDQKTDPSGRASKYDKRALREEINGGVDAEESGKKTSQNSLRRQRVSEPGSLTDKIDRWKHRPLTDNDSNYSPREKSPHEEFLDALVANFDPFAEDDATN